MKVLEEGTNPLLESIENKVTDELTAAGIISSIRSVSNGQNLMAGMTVTRIYCEEVLPIIIEFVS
jgi:hypothetical protein